MRLVSLNMKLCAFWCLIWDISFCSLRGVLRLLCWIFSMNSEMEADCWICWRWWVVREW